MTKRLDKDVIDIKYECLIIDNFPPADVFSVKVRAGQGDLKRGSVLALSAGTAGDAEMALLGETAASNETLTANCILTDDLSTGTATGAALDALAYRTGHFARNGVTVKEGYTITKTDEEDLRKGGILFDDAISY